MYADIGYNDFKCLSPAGAPVLAKKIRPSGCRFEPDEARLLRPPEDADEERALVLEKARLLALEEVTRELKAPADGEEAGREGDAHDRRRQRDRRCDERDADFVARLILRVLVVLLVALEQPAVRRVEPHRAFK
jgi:hypothetical protein